MNRKKNASSVSEMAVAAELFVSGFYPSKKTKQKHHYHHLYNIHYQCIQCIND